MERNNHARPDAGHPPTVRMQRGKRCGEREPPVDGARTHTAVPTNRKMSSSKLSVRVRNRMGWNSGLHGGQYLTDCQHIHQHRRYLVRRPIADTICCALAAQCHLLVRVNCERPSVASAFGYSSAVLHVMGTLGSQTAAALGASGTRFHFGCDPDYQVQTDRDGLVARKLLLPRNQTTGESAVDALLEPAAPDASPRGSRKSHVCRLAGRRCAHRFGGRPGR